MPDQKLLAQRSPRAEAIMHMSTRTPRVAQAQQADDSSEKKSRTQHTRSVFRWLDGISSDKDVPPAAFEVAYNIAQFLNWKTREGYPSTDTIADRAGMAQSTVRKMLNVLDNLGHLEVIRGRRGRGHPNIYRPIVKERSTAISVTRKERSVAVLDIAAKERLEHLKERGRSVKERGLAMNHCITTDSTERGGLTARPVNVDRADVTELTKTDDLYPRDRAFGALCEQFQKDPATETDARDVFDQLLDQGVYPDNIIIAAMEETDETIQLCDWLKNISAPERVSA
jgi:hypothetical protein